MEYRLKIQLRESFHKRFEFDHVTFTSQVSTLTKMTDSASSGSGSISGSGYSDFEASVDITKGFMNLLVKSGLGNLNRQDERDLK